MQITDAGITVKPLSFQFGTLLLSGGGGDGTTGGGPGGGVTGGGVTGGTTGSSSSDTTGGGGGGGFVPATLGLLGLLLGGIGFAASAPPQQAPVVAAGPAIVAPAPAPAVVAATP